MDLYLDSSNPREILEARSWGLLAGVTSNPGLIAAAGPDMEATLRGIVDASPGPVFAQVIGWHDPAPMIAPGALAARLFRPDHRQAARPASPACRPLAQLKAELPDLRLAVTAIASLAQAYLAAKAGADIAAIFNGPLDQAEDTAHDMIAPVRQIYDNYGFTTQILACGRYPRLFGEIAVAGADICTMNMEFMRLLYQHPFTEQRMNGFLDSWQRNLWRQDVAGAAGMSVLDLFKLTGKIAIVTGGARGLGRQMAIALAEAGADVAICDLLEEEGQRTAARTGCAGTSSDFWPG